MPYHAGQILEIMDIKERPLGTVEVVTVQGDLVCGQFRPQAAFSEVAELFAAFDEAVSVQALGVVDRLDAAIAALGLQARWAPDGIAEPIQDVQIYADGAFSCRLVAKNGVVAGRRTDAAALPASV